MKIHKGDNIQIMAGKDRGKQGKVLSVDATKGKVLVEGLNLHKRHKRPKKQGEKGEIISVPGYLNIANVLLVCDSCSKPVRVGFRKEGDNKVRYCKKCKNQI